MTKKLLLAGIAALTLGGATVSAPSTAQAQMYYGTGYYGGGPYYGTPYYGGGWGGYRSVGYYPRQAYYGGSPYYYRRRSNGGAVAAGLIGGLALGAIAASAARPAYYYPSYYPAAPVASTCWTERRSGYDRFGRLVVTRTRVCG